MGSMLRCCRKDDFSKDSSDDTESLSLRSSPTSRPVSQAFRDGKHVQFSSVVEIGSPWGSTRILDADLRSFGFKSIDEHARQARVEDAETFDKLLDYLKSWTPPDDEPTYTPVEPIVIRSLYRLPSAVGSRGSEQDDPAKKEKEDEVKVDEDANDDPSLKVNGTKDVDGDIVSHPLKPDSPRSVSQSASASRGTTPQAKTDTTPPSPHLSVSSSRSKEPKPIKSGLPEARIPVVEKLPVEGFDTDFAIIDAVEDANDAETILREEEREDDPKTMKRSSSKQSKTKGHAKIKSNGVGAAGAPLKSKSESLQSLLSDTYSRTSKGSKSGDVASFKRAKSGDVASVKRAKSGDVASVKSAKSGDVASVKSAKSGDVASVKSAKSGDVASVKSIKKKGPKEDGDRKSTSSKASKDSKHGPVNKVKSSDDEHNSPDTMAEKTEPSTVEATVGSRKVSIASLSKDAEDRLDLSIPATIEGHEIATKFDRSTSAASGSTTTSSGLPDMDKSMLYLVRALLVWMISHADTDLDEYDDEEDEEESPLFLLQLLQLGFITQAEMFSSLCLHADIFCEVVSGRCKGDYYLPGDVILDDDTWNAVFLAGGWRLIHPEWFGRKVQYFRRKKTKPPVEIKMAAPTDTSGKEANLETKEENGGDPKVESEGNDESLQLGKTEDKTNDEMKDEIKDGIKDENKEDKESEEKTGEINKDKPQPERASPEGAEADFKPDEAHTEDGIKETGTMNDLVEDTRLLKVAENTEDKASVISIDKDLELVINGQTPAQDKGHVHENDSKEKQGEHTFVSQEDTTTRGKDTFETDGAAQPMSSDGRRSVGFDTKANKETNVEALHEEREWDERWKDYEYPVPDVVKPRSAISIKSILKKDPLQDHSSAVDKLDLNFAESDILSLEESKPPVSVSMNTQQVQTAISSLHSSRKGSAASSRLGSAKRQRSAVRYPTEPPDPRKTVGQEASIDRTLAKLGMNKLGVEAAQQLYNDFWFITPPEQFIYCCFPNERKWQLLTRDRIVRSCNEFIQMANVFPAFFEFGLTLTSEQSCVVGSWHGVCLIQLEQLGFTPRRLHLLHEITPIEVDEPDYTTDDELKKLVCYSRSGDQFNFEIRFPTAGIYSFVVVGYEHGSKKKQKCCEFTLNCSKRLKRCLKLPIDPGQLGWGYGPCAEDVGLFQPSHVYPKIRIKALKSRNSAPPVHLMHRGCPSTEHIGQTLTLTFDIEEDKLHMTLYRTLLLNDEFNPRQVASLQEHVKATVDVEKRRLVIDVTVPVRGEYVLVIQAAKKPRRTSGKEAYYSVCNYLLTTLEKDTDEINHERAMNRNVVLQLVSETESSIQRLTNFNFKEDIERRIEIETQLKEFVRFIDNPYMRAIMNELIVKLQRVDE